MMQNKSAPAFISHLDQAVGKTVKLEGWVYNLRSSGKVRFILLRDGTGIVQCVLSYNDEKKKLFENFEELTQESALQVTGRVKEWKGQFEVDVEGFQILSKSENYPISKKEHGVDFLMTKRHLWLRSKRPHAALRVRHFLLKALRDFFENQNFTELTPPLFTPSACEGTSTLFPVESDGSESLFLSQSGQMYLEAGAAAFNKVYCINPAFRAEKSSTRRHLMEFWMCEAEMAFFDLKKNMDLIEEMILFVIDFALQKTKKELESLGRDLSLLKKIKGPFKRLHYEEAQDLILKKNPNFKKGLDFSGADETLLGSFFDKPFFIHHYPLDTKAFYMKGDMKGKPPYSLSCDLIAPEGFGEIVGGGQREESISTLEASLKKHKLDQKDFEWYLDLRRYGSFEHSGFGLGIERMTSWLCGLSHIREAIPFPRVYGRKFFENS